MNDAKSFPWLNGLLLCLSAVVGFLILWVGYEIYYWNHKAVEVSWHDPNTQFDSELGWAPIPNRSVFNSWGQISSNSQGYRGQVIDSSRSQIAVLGDSVVWGYGVGDESTMTYHLNKLLDSNHYQAINLGVSGYGIGQYYLYLERQTHLLNNLNTLVLVICTDNDWDNTSSNTSYGKRKPLLTLNEGTLQLVNPRIYKYSLKNLIYKSGFIRMLLYSPLKIPTRRLLNQLDKLSGDQHLSENKVSAVVFEILNQIHLKMQSQGVEFFVVLSPSKSDFDSKGEKYLLFEDMIGKTPYRVLNLLNHISSLPVNVDDLYFDEWHFSDYGNQVVAKAIQGVLQ